MAARFNGTGNIGLLLGPLSRNLVDVDLDCPAALELADKFLPDTPAVTGRASAPRSHRWYLAENIETTQYRDPKTKDMVLELRGAGAQTLVGPSIHPDSGESYDALDGEPALVSGNVLTTCVKALADAVIEARYGKQAARVNGSKRRAKARGRPAAPSATDDDAVYRRAVKYLDAMPPAISGSGGHKATYAAATAMVHGFGLDPEVACNLLRERFNPRCQPEWSETELRHKIEDADTEPHDRPYGWLRDADRETVVVDSVATTPLVEPVTVEPYLRFPTDLLPEPLRSFVKESAAAIGCDEAFIALPSLAAVAAAIGNKRQIRLKPQWAEPCVLWVVCVADSGALKSPSLDAAVAPTRRRQAKALHKYETKLEEFEQNKLFYERALTAWKRDKADGNPPEKPEPPVAERVVVSDITVESLVLLLKQAPNGLLLCRDELAGWLGGFDQYKGGRGGDAAAWLEMQRAGTVVVDRKTGDQRTLFVTRAAVSICGSIQPEILRRRLGDEHRQNGLLARLLLAMSPRQTKKWTDAEVHPTTACAIDSLYDRLFELTGADAPEGAVVPIDVGLDADAKETWIKFYNSHAEEQASSDDHDFISAWAKLEGYAARLALIHHCIRTVTNDDPPDDNRLVDCKSIEAGIALSRWFGREAKRVYAALRQTEDAAEEDRLLSFVRERGGTVTPREVVQGIWQVQTVGQAVVELNTLVNAGLGAWAYSSVGKKGGRQSKRFRLNEVVSST